VNKDDQKHTHI